MQRGVLMLSKQHVLLHILCSRNVDTYIGKQGTTSTFCLPSPKSKEPLLLTTPSMRKIMQRV